MTARAAAAARHWLWRLVLTLTGGCRVAGSLPRGGCVVVANHSSHADTAALLAALPSRNAPRVAAAADYWFAAGWRSATCRALGAAFPVRRTGGGSADMAAAVALLRAGRAVVVYPEGTRGHAAPARFHAGAFRLAAAAEVPVVPVGITGTAELLPKHGTLHRTRVSVRIGDPVAADPDLARTEVARLAAAPDPEPAISRGGTGAPRDSRCHRSGSRSWRPGPPRRRSCAALGLGRSAAGTATPQSRSAGTPCSPPPSPRSWPAGREAPGSTTRSARMATVRTTPDEPSAGASRPRAVFRVSPLVVLVALALAVCATPVAGSAPYLWLLYLVPAGIIVWTLRVRTVADPDAVTVRGVVGGRSMPWSEITSVHVGRARNPQQARVSAVLSDGSEHALPAVHVRDLPRLAAASGGRLPDPGASENSP